MARTVRELIADGQRNEALYLKRLADEHWNQAFQEARFAERWASAEREGWPHLHDFRRKRTWFRQCTATQPGGARGAEGDG